MRASGNDRHPRLPVKSLEHEHIPAADHDQLGLARTDSRAPSQVERRVFDALKIELVATFGKLRNSVLPVVFNRRLGTRAHAGAGLELFDELYRHGTIVLDGFRSGDQLDKLVRAVIRASWRERLAFQSKAQVAGTILRPVHAVIDILEIRRCPLQSMSPRECFEISSSQVPFRSGL